LEKYIRKVEEIAVLLGLIAGDLKEIAEDLKAAVSEAAQQPPEAEAEAKVEHAAEPAETEIQEEAGPLTLGKIQHMFPEELLGKLYFEDAGDSIVVRPREYLGTEMFRRIAKIACDQLGGTYISAGRNSRFIIPKEKPAV